MTDNITEAEKAVTDKFVKTAGGYGLSPTIAKIYMTLFFSTEPIGLKEISEKTGYSISTVCGALDLVERIMDIRKFQKPGSKKIYYECQHNVLLAMHKKLNESRKQIQPLIQVLGDALDKLGGDKSPKATKVKEYLTQLKKDYETYASMIDRLSEVHSFVK